MNAAHAEPPIIRAPRTRGHLGYQQIRNKGHIRQAGNEPSALGVLSKADDSRSMVAVLMFRKKSQLQVGATEEVVVDVVFQNVEPTSL